ncbi:MAG: 6,7-dimethyl-8-ribityllumazine synthase [Bacteroidales bacterium]|jgi:6,7-dimethyl-8-ribityllumazine synthase|nr:6,7-dimethyl-8-ribityllumazine synthase [Bacteroidales bacterium]
MLKENSPLNLKNIPDGAPYRIAIVTAEWNDEITSSLRRCCIETLLKYGVLSSGIVDISVPGTFELSTVSSVFAARKDIDAVICLGCVIQGETRHFEFICNAVANGLTSAGISSGKPVLFGVITADTLAQAKARSANDHNNKGYEAAISALKMLDVLK